MVEPQTLNQDVLELNPAGVLYCVLKLGIFKKFSEALVNTQKEMVYLDMTEKLLTGTLNLNTTSQTVLSLIKLGNHILQPVLPNCSCTWTLAGA